MSRWRWIVAIALTLGIPLAVVSFLLGLVDYAIWRFPFTILLVGAFGLALAVAIGRVRRMERAEVKRFERRLPCSDAELLRELGIEASSSAARIALHTRKLLAELGSAPPDSFRAADRFYPDLQRLPFYDSVDAMAFIVGLEEALDVQLSEDEQWTFLEMLEARESPTVGAVIAETVRVARQKGLACDE